MNALSTTFWRQNCTWYPQCPLVPVEQVPTEYLNAAGWMIKKTWFELETSIMHVTRTRNWNDNLAQGIFPLWFDNELYNKNMELNDHKLDFFVPIIQIGIHRWSNRWSYWSIGRHSKHWKFTIFIKYVSECRYSTGMIVNVAQLCMYSRMEYIIFYTYRMRVIYETLRPIRRSKFVQSK